ncbi:hypothetical protein BO99DRAFT_234517 [Aspergillus violaceofuscus CBS 115571]|uniref:Uncharacterized protein n=1 Tax=Aspergillus violaceofuscus (strain CBS 115571) TaxID=1450538 RepID=A0A2V5GX74_ASPV1|nr:hypothetical protein BO99DRAFT_234517 [Aspergillus violaceofuscus CBS 115571]
MEQVFLRWPNVHLSQRAVDATVDDLRKFPTLVKERPSIKVSTEAITSLCNSWRNPNRVDTMKEILIFQPGVILTEEMFLAATEYSEVFDALLRHEPCVNLTDNVIGRAMSRMNRTNLLRAILVARKDFHFSPQSISIICDRYGYDKDIQACVTEVLARSRNTILGENEMCDVVKTGSPGSLGAILSQRPDAVVTENVVKYLMDVIKADRGAENFLRRWRYEFEDEAFDMLLERSGLIDLKRQMLKSQVRKLIWG